MPVRQAQAAKPIHLVNIRRVTKLHVVLEDVLIMIYQQHTLALGRRQVIVVEVIPVRHNAHTILSVQQLPVEILFLGLTIAVDAVQHIHPEIAKAAALVAEDI
jgi:hypothetical protein